MRSSRPVLFSSTRSWRKELPSSSPPSSPSTSRHRCPLRIDLLHRLTLRFRLPRLSFSTTPHSLETVLQLILRLSIWRTSSSCERRCRPSTIARISSVCRRKGYTRTWGGTREWRGSMICFCFPRARLVKASDTF